MKKRVSYLFAALTLSLLNSSAHALMFSFSFENVLNGGGVVSGLISGLEEGTGPATRVEVLSNTAGFGVGVYSEGLLTPNVWTVTDGVLTRFSFTSFGIQNTLPDVVDSTLFFDSDDFNGTSFRAGISNDPTQVVISRSGVSTEDINLQFALVPVSEPSVITLYLSGLALLVFLRRRQGMTLHS